MSSSATAMPRPATNCSKLPCSSKLLQKRWEDRAYRVHLQKMNSMKAGLDNAKPQSYLHLRLRMKKIQAEEEKQAKIEHDNRILLAKLTGILRSQGGLDNWNFGYEPKSLNMPYKEKQLEKIAAENQALMTRLTKAKSYYKTDSWEDEYLMHQYYLGMKANETKQYDHYRRSARDFIENIEDGRSKTMSKTYSSFGESNYSDIEESLDKVGQLKSDKKKPPLKRQVSKLPVIGNQRKKEEALKKKLAAHNASLAYDEKSDASLLFQAIHGMANLQTTVIKTMARRSYWQRQKTKKMFEEKYRLNLLEELKEKLGEGYDDALYAFLQEREVYDAVTLQHALQGIGSMESTLIEILCTRSNAALGAIKRAFSAKYKKPLEDVIKENSEGQFMQLLQALAKGDRNESSAIDKEQAKADASTLQQLKDGERWIMDGSRFMEMLMDYSFAQLRCILEEYEKFTNLTMEEIMEAELDDQMQDAMVALVKCIKSSPDFMAEKLHESLTEAGDDATVLRCLVTRAEVDLSQIRKAYKRRYRQPLVEELEMRFGEPYKKVLVELFKHLGLQEEMAKKNEGGMRKKAAGMTIQGPPKLTKLKRPAAEQNVQLVLGSPLAKIYTSKPKPAKKPEWKD